MKVSVGLHIRTFFLTHGKRGYIHTASWPGRFCFFSCDPHLVNIFHNNAQVGPSGGAPQ